MILNMILVDGRNLQCDFEFSPNFQISNFYLRVHGTHVNYLRGRGWGHGSHNHGSWENTYGNRCTRPDGNGFGDFDEFGYWFLKERSFKTSFGCKK